MNGRLKRSLAGFVLAACAMAASAADGPRVTNAWARATAPGVDVGAVYMTIDGGATADRLVAGSTTRASMVHLHTVEEEDGVAKMRGIDAVDVPAGKRVELAPKGTHVMLMGLGKPLAAGETFPLTLKFEKAGELTVDVAVRAATDDHSQHAQH
jgi:copper(I)-binding protein